MLASAASVCVSSVVCGVMSACQSAQQAEELTILFWLRKQL